MKNWELMQILEHADPDANVWFHGRDEVDIVLVAKVDDLNGDLDLAFKESDI